MTPVKGESLALKTNHLPLRYTVFGTDGYLVPKASGEIVVGATEVPGQMSQGVSAQATQALLSMALRYVPALADATVTRVYASVRPGSPDGLPYIGKWEGIENLYIATGHYRNGILLSPLTGEWITRMIMGEESEDWKPFSPMRLAKQEGGVR
jgi:glycine oxidase